MLEALIGVVLVSALVWAVVAFRRYLHNHRNVTILPEFNRKLSRQVRRAKERAAVWRQHRSRNGRPLTDKETGAIVTRPARRRNARIHLALLRMSKRLERSEAEAVAGQTSPRVVV